MKEQYAKYKIWTDSALRICRDGHARLVSRFFAERTFYARRPAAIPLLGAPFPLGGEASNLRCTRYTVRNMRGWKRWLPWNWGKMQVVCYYEESDAAGENAYAQADFKRLLDAKEKP